MQNSQSCFSPLRWLAACLLVAGGAAHAGDLHIAAKTPGGEQLPDLVLYLTHADGTPAGGTSDAGAYSVGQKNIQFAPFMTVVPTGAQVRFVNADKVAHHVFSFSGQAPENLELIVRPGQTSEPYLFGKEGFSRIGCNIHDSMNAYIFAAPSRLYAVSSAMGEADIGAVPAGDYILWVWSSEQTDSPLLQERLRVDGPATHLNLTVPAPKRPKAQRRSFDDY